MSSPFCFLGTKMKQNKKKGEIMLYQPKGEVKLEVRAENVFKANIS